MARKRVTYKPILRGNAIGANPIAFLGIANSKECGPEVQLLLEIISTVNLAELDSKTSKDLKNPKILAKVNTALSNTIEVGGMVPTIQYSAEGWTTEWARKIGRNLADSVITAGILDLAGLGNLWRLRRCVCRQYFLARVEAQRFHSAKCREKAFKSTPEWKQYRNSKAREYYLLHKKPGIK